MIMHNNNTVLAVDHQCLQAPSSNKCNPTSVISQSTIVKKNMDALYAELRELYLQCLERIVDLPIPEQTNMDHVSVVGQQLRRIRIIACSACPVNPKSCSSPVASYAQQHLLDMHNLGEIRDDLKLTLDELTEMERQQCDEGSRLGEIGALLLRTNNMLYT